MDILDFIPGGRTIQLVVVGILAAALLGGVTWGVHTYNEGLREEGRTEVRLEVAAKERTQHEADMQKAAQNAAESQRRIFRQSENQDAQNLELAAARDAAARNAAAADRMRRDHASEAEQWRARLADSPSRADLEAASAAIDLLTDLLGRADRRAGELAAFADTSRAHGLKCERDYQAVIK